MTRDEFFKIFNDVAMSQETLESVWCIMQVEGYDIVKKQLPHSIHIGFGQPNTSGDVVMPGAFSRPAPKEAGPTENVTHINGARCELTSCAFCSKPFYVSVGFAKFAKLCDSCERNPNVPRPR